MRLCSHNGLLVMLLFHLCQAQGIVTFFFNNTEFVLESRCKGIGLQSLYKDWQEGYYILRELPSGQNSLVHVESALDASMFH